MKECNWPNCMTPKEQHQLAGDVYLDLIGAEGPRGEPIDHTLKCGCQVDVHPNE